MPVLLDQFVQTLSDSGLMTKEELDQLLKRLPEDKKPADGQEMATLLFRQGKLTKYQAQAVYQGKAKGLILGDYVLLDEIGAGGMGQVFKAQHRRMKRIVALKLLPAEMTTSEEAVGRFQQEVEVAARLIHPNVVTAFDAGEHKKMYFLVMEYVEGRDLESVVAERGKLPVAEAVNYIIQAATGLAYAHSQGVIHRDIKPSNLFLDKNGTVKILDMGLARTERDTSKFDETAPRAITRTGDVMGTVDYMSPEQTSSTKHVDERADMYSLGCTLYYLLTGKPVFEGDTLVERVMAHRDKPIPSICKVRGDVPQSVDLIFRRMVGKKPEYRYKSMNEVIAELQKCDLRGSGSSGPSKFVPTPRPVAETQVLNRTVRTEALAAPAEGTPAPQVAAPAASPRPPTKSDASSQTQASSAPPPPPDITPRKRGAEVRPERTKRDRDAERRAEFQKEMERKQKWQNTVSDAVKDQKRKAWWGRVGRLLSIAVAGTTKWVLLLVVLAGLGGGGFFLWQNSQKLLRCQESVLSAINVRLKQSEYDEIGSFSFSDASFLQPLPETLSFEHPLYQTTAAGRRQAAMLKGTFNRVNGTVAFTQPVPLQFQIEPVK